MASYKDAIEVAVRSEMQVVGDGVAVNAACTVDGLEVADDGSVEELSRPGGAVLQRLVEVYIDRFGTVSASLIARKLEEEIDLEDLQLPPEITQRLSG